MVQARQQRDWDDLGTLDPLWAVLSAPKGKHGGWDEAEFFHSGQVVIDQVMAAADRLGHPAARDHALDFGCGVGRLTRALAAHFQHCTGVDIASAMVERAQALNAAYPACDFQANPYPDLRLLPADHFDMICSLRVLQHLPDRAAIKVMLAEFVRTLRPGGLLVFQLLSDIPTRNRLQPRRRLYGGRARLACRPACSTSAWAYRLSAWASYPSRPCWRCLGSWARRCWRCRKTGQATRRSVVGCIMSPNDEAK